MDSLIAMHVSCEVCGVTRFLREGGRITSETYCRLCRVDDGVMNDNIVRDFCRNLRDEDTDDSVEEG